MNNTKLLAVTGNPVLHSKSPNMFNHVFDAMQIDAAYFRLAANSASEAVATFKSLGLTGMNVTAPFKEEIIKELDWVHEDAKLIGGVNTVVCDDGILKGYNTDHFGVAQSLIDAGVVLRDTKCIVVGAGGAGRAAAFGMINKGADVTIVNRTVEKARDCAKKFGCKYASLEDITQLIDDTKVIVFSLSQNVNIIPEEYIKPHHIIFDANYKASQTAIIAKERGCTVIQGLDWLLNQAIPAFRLFFGFDPDRGAMQMDLPIIAY
jgi:shikimate dehydrogenase